MSQWVCLWNFIGIGPETRKFSLVCCSKHVVVGDGTRQRFPQRPVSESDRPTVLAGPQCGHSLCITPLLFKRFQWNLTDTCRGIYSHRPWILRKSRQFLPGHFAVFLGKALRFVGFLPKWVGGRPGSQGVCISNFIEIGPETRLFSLVCCSKHVVVGDGTRQRFFQRPVSECDRPFTVHNSFDIQAISMKLDRYL